MPQLFVGTYRSATASTMSFAIMASSKEEAESKFWNTLKSWYGSDFEEITGYSEGDGVKILDIEIAEDGIWIEDE